MKKAELAINQVIMIVIGLLVLILVVALVINASQKGEQTAFNCENAGGECKSEECGPDYFRLALGDKDCEKRSQGNFCCRPK